MPYSAEISRSHPTCFLFLIDQSGSMSDQASNLMMTKAQFVADALNRVVMNLIARSSKAEGVRDYFEISRCLRAPNSIVVFNFQLNLVNSSFIK